MHVFDMYVPAGVGALVFLYYTYGGMEEAGLAERWLGIGGHKGTLIFQCQKG